MRGDQTSCICRRGGEFRNRVGDSGDVGIFHETYRVENGNYEVIYHHMPPFGLRKVGELIEIGGHHENAGGRMGK